MSGRARSGMAAAARMPPKGAWDRMKAVKEKELKGETPSCGRRPANPQNVPHRSRSARRIALRQDVDRLKRKLRHEEDVHRALERAFTRPLGTLPRLPPYLPPQTLELLAEVAVLEEEVVRLEEQVLDFRWGLYQEAVYISSSKKAIESSNKPEPQLETLALPSNERSSPSQSSSGTDQTEITSSPVSRCQKPIGNSDCLRGKENQTTNNLARVAGQSSPQKKMAGVVGISSAKIHCKEARVRNANRISEDLLRCLSDIFLRMSPLDSEQAMIEADPSVSGFQGGSIDDIPIPSQDPYDICIQFGKRDIGPYKNLRSIDQKAINRNLVTDSSTPLCNLRLLLRKLMLVDLRGLSHQEKLAFWINIYNSCMMNTFLEHGIPATPQMVVALIQKAVINVGGHILSAMTIEHFILRLPFDSKYAFSKVARKDEMAIRSNLGLDWPEPLVTFALSCGSWSSPAVRVYTASGVENELQAAKQDYLQAAIGISPKNKLAIPKLLDWYLLDFAKDVQSLLDWICLQLPSGLRNDAVKCIERGKQGAFPSQNVQVLPYEFAFRYLLGV